MHNAATLTRIRAYALRLIAIALFTCLASGAMLDSAAAKPSPNSYQNGFVAACRNHGGTPRRVTTRVVRCTLPDGGTITCNFNVDPPACTIISAIVQTGSGVVVSGTANVFTVAETSTNGAESRGTAQRTGNVTIASRDDDEL